MECESGDQTKTKSPMRGRPRQDPELARSKRVVTFVTAADLAGLEGIARDEQRSLSAVVNQIISNHLRGKL